MKPIEYLVLQAEQLSAKDKIEVAATLASVRTAADARELTKNGWAFEIRDYLGHIGVLKFKGVEVAMMIHRQVIKKEPLPQDPIPEGIIEDPKDAWMRVDLLGVNPRNVAAKAGKQAASLSAELDVLRKEVKAKDELIAQYEIADQICKKIIADLEKKVKTKKG